MANIFYLTRDDFMTDTYAGGMGTKTRAIFNAWQDSGIHKIRVASSLASLNATQHWQPGEDRAQSDKYDVCMLELLALNKFEHFDNNIAQLKAFPGAILVYGSDSELLRWKGKYIKRLSEVVDMWVANCRWQASYFSDFGLPVAGVVHEPIDSELFYPSEERIKTIMAGGMISYRKHSDFFVKLFEALKPVQKDYKTAYIGSCEMWGRKPDPKDVALQKDIEAVADVFHGAIRPEKVARHLGEGAVGVLNPKYETCNRFHMELMCCGKPTVCGVHICYDERPVTRRFGTLDECIEVLGELTNDFEELPEKELGEKAREHAELHFSYEKTLEDFNNVLRRVL